MRDEHAAQASARQRSRKRGQMAGHADAGIDERRSGAVQQPRVVAQAGEGGGVQGGDQPGLHKRDCKVPTRLSMGSSKPIESLASRFWNHAMRAVEFEVGHVVACPLELRHDAIPRSAHVVHVVPGTHVRRKFWAFRPVARVARRTRVRRR